jgi:hypothetical protein
MFENQYGDPNIFISVDKLLLLGILYTPSKVSSSKGNNCKALLFFHLIHGEDIVAKIKRDSKRLR